MYPYIYIRGSFPAKLLRNCMFSLGLVQSLSHAVIHILWLFLCCHPTIPNRWLYLHVRMDGRDWVSQESSLCCHPMHPTRWLFLRVGMDGKDWFCTPFSLWPYLPYHVFNFDLMVQRDWEYRILVWSLFIFIPHIKMCLDTAYFAEIKKLLLKVIAKIN